MTVEDAVVRFEDLRIWRGSATVPETKTPHDSDFGITEYVRIMMRPDSSFVTRKQNR